MLRGLFLLALAAVAGWLAYRRTRPRPHAAPFDAMLPLQPTQLPNSQLAVAPPTPVAAETPAKMPAKTPAEVPVGMSAESGAVLEAYCMRCKVHRPIMGQKIETTASGRRAAKGTCPVCGAKLNRFLPSL